MKKILCAISFLMVGMMLTGVIWAADKEAIEKQIKNQVDEVVAAIDSGKKAEDFKILAKKEPYSVFIVDQNGKLLVHPTLEGSSLQTWKATYDAVIQATAGGLWVEYEYYGKPRRSYVRKTKDGLIVGSGYSDSTVATGGVKAFGQEWSDEQKEVWKMEIAYWDYFKEGDIKGYMTLWHKDVIAWPHNSPKPIGKEILEKVMTGKLKLLSYDLKPLAINIFGNFAFIYYRVNAIGKDSPNFSARIGHLWMKQDGKWQIIGGYSGGSTIDDK